MKKDKLIFYYLTALPLVGIVSVGLQTIYIFLFTNPVLYVLNMFISGIESIYLGFAIFIIIWILQHKLPKLLLISPITFLITIIVTGVVYAFHMITKISQDPESIGILSNAAGDIGVYIMNLSIYAIQIPICIYLLAKYRYIKW